jgi:hypothetical protein
MVAQLSTSPGLFAAVHAHRLYAEYSALPVGIVTQCALNHAAMVQAVWHELPGESWSDKVGAFYERGEECVFDLLGCGRASSPPAPTRSTSAAGSARSARCSASRTSA